MSVREIRDAIENMTQVLSEEPEKALSTGAATATLESGLRFRLSGQNSSMAFTDMPISLGGQGSAAKPGWFLRASLASCNATVIAMRAAQLDIELKTLEVTVISNADTRGLLGSDDSVSAGLFDWRTQVRIGADEASPEQLREIVTWAEAHSPVSCSIRDVKSTEVEIEIV
ncbi:MAG: putative OsmC-like protein [Gammaproteobacteria bacterium]|jgi:uncharacterized OsmC-like protein